MRKCLFILAGILVIPGFCSFVKAEETQGGAMPTITEVVKSEAEVVSEASEPSPQDPGEMVENLINQYLDAGNGRRIRQKLEHEGGWYGSAWAEVSVGPENPNWGKYRVLAYQRAIMDVEAQYLKTLMQQIKTEKMKRFFKNASDMVPDFQPEDVEDPGKFGILLNKLLALGEGKLDQMLDDLGVDKGQFDRKPKPQRQTLLREAINRSTTIEAFGSLSGFLPVQTFEGYTKKGEHAIGVICVQTPRLKQFAYDILHSRGNVKPKEKKGRNLYELFSKNDKILISQFGIRKMKDEQGYPVLVSLGQWANSKRTGNKRIQRRYRAAAKKQAEAIANSQIAFFLESTANYQSDSEIGEIFDESYNVYEDNYKEADITDTILDEVNEKSRARASVNLSGLIPLYSWTQKHPQYDQEIVGVVMKWSPRDEKTARHLKDWKPKTNKAVGGQSGTQASKGSSGTITGEEYMNLDDF